MKAQIRATVKKTILASGVAAAAAVLFGASSAAAAVDDSFSVATTEGYNCGTADFIDYGDEVPGSGPWNDDYLWINDNCADGHGVAVWAWLTPAGTSSQVSLGHTYDGNGATGKPLVWDPFPAGNVKAGDTVTVKVCSVDGPSDTTPSDCGTATGRSVDG